MNKATAEFFKSVAEKQGGAGYVALKSLDLRAQERQKFENLVRELFGDKTKTAKRFRTLATFDPSIVPSATHVFQRIKDMVLKGEIDPKSAVDEVKRFYQDTLLYSTLEKVKKAKRQDFYGIWNDIYSELLRLSTDDGRATHLLNLIHAKVGAEPFFSPTSAAFVRFARAAVPFLGLIKRGVEAITGEKFYEPPIAFDSPAEIGYRTLELAGFGLGGWLLGSGVVGALGRLGAGVRALRAGLATVKGAKGLRAAMEAGKLAEQYYALAETARRTGQTIKLTDNALKLARLYKTSHTASDIAVNILWNVAQRTLTYEEPILDWRGLAADAIFGISFPVLERIRWLERFDKNALAAAIRGAGSFTLISAMTQYALGYEPSYVKWLRELEEAAANGDAQAISLIDRIVKAVKEGTLSQYIPELIIGSIMGLGRHISWRNIRQMSPQQFKLWQTHLDNLAKQLEQGKVRPPQPVDKTQTADPQKLSQQIEDVDERLKAIEGMLQEKTQQDVEEATEKATITGERPKTEDDKPNTNLMEARRRQPSPLWEQIRKGEIQLKFRRKAPEEVGEVPIYELVMPGVGKVAATAAEKVLEPEGVAAVEFGTPRFRETRIATEEEISEVRRRIEEPKIYTIVTPDGNVITSTSPIEDLFGKGIVSAEFAPERKTPIFTVVTPDGEVYVSSQPIEKVSLESDVFVATAGEVKTLTPKKHYFAVVPVDVATKARANNDFSDITFYPDFLTAIEHAPTALSSVSRKLGRRVRQQPSVVAGKYLSAYREAVEFLSQRLRKRKTRNLPLLPPPTHWENLVVLTVAVDHDIANVLPDKPVRFADLKAHQVTVTSFEVPSAETNIAGKLDEVIPEVTAKAVERIEEVTVPKEVEPRVEEPTQPKVDEVKPVEEVEPKPTEKAKRTKRQPEKPAAAEKAAEAKEVAKAPEETKTAEEKPLAGLSLREYRKRKGEVTEEPKPAPETKPTEEAGERPLAGLSLREYRERKRTGEVAAEPVATPEPEVQPTEEGERPLAGLSLREFRQRKEREQAEASQQFKYQLPEEVESKLREMGYTDAQIENLRRRPDEAQRIIDEGLPPNQVSVLRDGRVVIVRQQRETVQQVVDELVKLTGKEKSSAELKQAYVVAKGISEAVEDKSHPVAQQAERVANELETEAARKGLGDQVASWKEEASDYAEDLRDTWEVTGDADKQIEGRAIFHPDLAAMVAWLSDLKELGMDKEAAVEILSSAFTDMDVEEIRAIYDEAIREISVASTVRTLSQLAESEQKQQEQSSQRVAQKFAAFFDELRRNIRKLYARVKSVTVQPDLSVLDKEIVAVNITDKTRTAKPNFGRRTLREWLTPATTFEDESGFRVVVTYRVPSRRTPIALALQEHTNWLKSQPNYIVKEVELYGGDKIVAAIQKPDLSKTHDLTAKRILYELEIAVNNFVEMVKYGEIDGAIKGFKWSIAHLPSLPYDIGLRTIDLSAEIHMRHRAIAFVVGTERVLELADPNSDLMDTLQTVGLPYDTTQLTLWRDENLEGLVAGIGEIPKERANELAKQIIEASKTGYITPAERLIAYKLLRDNIVATEYQLPLIIAAFDTEQRFASRMAEGIVPHLERLQDAVFGEVFEIMSALNKKVNETTPVLYYINNWLLRVAKVFKNPDFLEELFYDDAHDAALRRKEVQQALAKLDPDVRFRFVAAIKGLPPKMEAWETFVGDFLAREFKTPEQKERYTPLFVEVSKVFLKAVTEEFNNIKSNATIQSLMQTWRKFLNGEADEAEQRLVADFILMATEKEANRIVRLIKDLTPEQREKLAKGLKIAMAERLFGMIEHSEELRTDWEELRSLGENILQRYNARFGNKINLSDKRSGKSNTSPSPTNIVAISMADSLFSDFPQFDAWMDAFEGGTLNPDDIPDAFPFAPVIKRTYKALNDYLNKRKLPDKERAAVRKIVTDQLKHQLGWLIFQMSRKVSDELMSGKSFYGRRTVSAARTLLHRELGGLLQFYSKVKEAIASGDFKSLFSLFDEINAAKEKHGARGLFHYRRWIGDKKLFSLKNLSVAKPENILSVAKRSLEGLGLSKERLKTLEKVMEQLIPSIHEAIVEGLKESSNHIYFTKRLFGWAAVVAAVKHARFDAFSKQWLEPFIKGALSAIYDTPQFEALVNTVAAEMGIPHNRQQIVDLFTEIFVDRMSERITKFIHDTTIYKAEGLEENISNLYEVVDDLMESRYVNAKVDTINRLPLLIREANRVVEFFSGLIESKDKLKRIILGSDEILVFGDSDLERIRRTVETLRNLVYDLSKVDTDTLTDKLLVISDILSGENRVVLKIGKDADDWLLDLPEDAYRFILRSNATEAVEGVEGAVTVNVSQLLNEIYDTIRRSPYNTELVDALVELAHDLSSYDILLTLKDVTDAFNEAKAAGEVNTKKLMQHYSSSLDANRELVKTIQSALSNANYAASLLDSLPPVPSEALAVSKGEAIKLSGDWRNALKAPLIKYMKAAQNLREAIAKVYGKDANQLSVNDSEVRNLFEVLLAAVPEAEAEQLAAEVEKPQETKQLRTSLFAPKTFPTYKPIKIPGPQDILDAIGELDSAWSQLLYSIRKFAQQRKQQNKPIHVRDIMLALNHIANTADEFMSWHMRRMMEQTIYKGNFLRDFLSTIETRRTKSGKEYKQRVWLVDRGYFDEADYSFESATALRQLDMEVYIRLMQWVSENIETIERNYARLEDNIKLSVGRSLGESIVKSSLAGTGLGARFKWLTNPPHELPDELHKLIVGDWLQPLMVVGRTASERAERMERRAQMFGTVSEAEFVKVETEEVAPRLEVEGGTVTEGVYEEAPRVLATTEGGTVTAEDFGVTSPEELTTVQSEVAVGLVPISGEIMLNNAETAFYAGINDGLWREFKVPSPSVLMAKTPEERTVLSAWTWQIPYLTSKLAEALVDLADATPEKVASVTEKVWAVQQNLQHVRERIKSWADIDMVTYPDEFDKQLQLADEKLELALNALNDAAQQTGENRHQAIEAAREKLQEAQVHVRNGESMAGALYSINPIPILVGGWLLWHYGGEVALGVAAASFLAHQAIKMLARRGVTLSKLAGDVGQIVRDQISKLPKTVRDYVSGKPQLSAIATYGELVRRATEVYIRARSQLDTTERALRDFLTKPLEEGGFASAFARFKASKKLQGVMWKEILRDDQLLNEFIDMLKFNYGNDPRIAVFANLATNWRNLLSVTEQAANNLKSAQIGYFSATFQTHAPAFALTDIYTIARMQHEIALSEQVFNNPQTADTVFEKRAQDFSNSAMTRLKRINSNMGNITPITDFFARLVSTLSGIDPSVGRVNRNLQRQRSRFEQAYKIMAAFTMPKNSPERQQMDAVVAQLTPEFFAVSNKTTFNRAITWLYRAARLKPNDPAVQQLVAEWTNNQNTWLKTLTDLWGETNLLRREIYSAEDQILLWHELVKLSKNRTNYQAVTDFYKLGKPNFDPVNYPRLTKLAMRLDANRLVFESKLDFWRRLQGDPNFGVLASAVLDAIEKVTKERLSAEAVIAAVSQTGGLGSLFAMPNAQALMNLFPIADPAVRDEIRRWFAENIDERMTIIADRQLAELVTPIRQALDRLAEKAKSKKVASPKAAAAFLFELAADYYEKPTEYLKDQFASVIFKELQDIPSLKGMFADEAELKATFEEVGQALRDIGNEALNLINLGLQIQGKPPIKPLENYLPHFIVDFANAAILDPNLFERKIREALENPVPDKFRRGKSEADIRSRYQRLEALPVSDLWLNNLEAYLNRVVRFALSADVIPVLHQLESAIRALDVESPLATFVRDLGVLMMAGRLPEPVPNLTTVINRELRMAERWETEAAQLLSGAESEDDIRKAFWRMRQHATLQRYIPNFAIARKLVEFSARKFLQFNLSTAVAQFESILGAIMHPYDSQMNAFKSTLQAMWIMSVMPEAVDFVYEMSPSAASHKLPRERWVRMMPRGKASEILLEFHRVVELEMPHLAALLTGVKEKAITGSETALAKASLEELDMIMSNYKTVPSLARALIKAANMIERGFDVVDKLGFLALEVTDQYVTGLAGLSAFIDAYTTEISRGTPHDRAVELARNHMERVVYRTQGNYGIMQRPMAILKDNFAAALGLFQNYLIHRWWGLYEGYYRPIYSALKARDYEMLMRYATMGAISFLSWWLLQQGYIAFTGKQAGGVSEWVLPPIARVFIDWMFDLGSAVYYKFSRQLPAFLQPMAEIATSLIASREKFLMPTVTVSGYELPKELQAEKYWSSVWNTVLFLTFGTAAARAYNQYLKAQRGVWMIPTEVKEGTERYDEEGRLVGAEYRPMLEEGLGVAKFVWRMMVGQPISRNAWKDAVRFNATTTSTAERRALLAKYIERARNTGDARELGELIVYSYAPALAQTFRAIERDYAEGKITEDEMNAYLNHLVNGVQQYFSVHGTMALSRQKAASFLYSKFTFGLQLLNERNRKAQATRQLRREFVEKAVLPVETTP